MSSNLFALTQLPQTGYDVLMKTNDLKTLKALAVSSFTPANILSKLAKHSSLAISTKAIRRCDDVELVNNFAKQNNVKSIGALWNKLASTDVVEAALTSSDRTISCVAFGNPNSDVEVRKALLTPDRFKDLTEVGSCMADKVVRAAVVLDNNLYLAERIAEISSFAKRAIASSAWASSDHFDLIKNSGWSHWEHTKTHPARLGQSIYLLNMQELFKLNCSAADLLIIQDPNCDLKMARKLFTASGHIEVEPQVLALAVNRFGIEVLAGSKKLAGTRVFGAGWIEPSAEYYEQVKDFAFDDLKAAAIILEENPTAWEFFIKLATGWNRSYVELAENAVRM